MEAPRSARPMLGDANTPNACGELSFRSRCNSGYGDLLTDDDLKTERATEPPRKWRNWWRGAFNGWCNACGTHLPANEVYTDCCRGPFPSRDVAETAANEDIQDQLTHEAVSDEYLGAHPEGERP